MNGLFYLFSDIVSTVNTVVSIINIVFIVLLILSMLLGFARGIFRSSFWLAVTLVTFIGGWLLLPSVTEKLLEIDIAQFLGTNAHFANETAAEYVQVLLAKTLYGDYIIVGEAVCTVDAAIVSEMIIYQLVIALVEMVLRIALIIVIFILNVTLFKIIYAIVLAIVKPRKVDSLGNKKHKTIPSRIGGACVGALIFLLMFLFMLTPIAGVFSIAEKADEILIPNEIKNPDSEQALYLSYNNQIVPLNSNTVTGMIESTGLSLQEVSTIANAYRNTFFGKVFSIKFGGIELDNRVFDTLFKFELEGDRIKIRREVVTLINALQIVYEKIGEDHPVDLSIIDSLDDETINRFFAEIAKLELFDIVIPISTEYVYIQSEIESEKQEVFVSLIDVVEALEGKDISELLIEIGNCVSKMKNILDSAGITTEDFNKLSDPELSKEVIAKMLSANPIIVKDAFNAIADLDIIDSFKALFVNSMNGEGALRAILTIVPKVENDNGYYTIDGVQTGIKAYEDEEIYLEQLEGYWLLNGHTTDIKVEYIVLDYTDVVLSQNIRNIGNLYEALYKLGVKSFDLSSIVTEENTDKFTLENIENLAQAVIDFTLLSAFEGNFQTLIDSMLPHELKGKFVIPDELSKGEFVAIIGIGKAVLESGIIEQAQNGEEIDFVRLIKEYKDEIAEYAFKSEVLANNMEGLISFLLLQTGMEPDIVKVPEDFDWSNNGEEELKSILTAASMILDIKTTDDGKILGITNQFVDELAAILNESKILKESLPEIIEYVNTLEFLQSSQIEIIVDEDEEIDLVEIKSILKTAKHIIEINNEGKDVVVELLKLPIEEWDEMLKSDIIAHTVVNLLYKMTEVGQPLEGIIVLNLGQNDSRWYGQDGELRKIVINIRKLLGDDFTLDGSQDEMINTIITNLINATDQDITDLTSSIVIKDSVVHQLHSFKYDPQKAPENIIIIPDNLSEDSEEWLDNNGEPGEIRKIIAAAKIIFEGVDEIDFNNISVNTIANLSEEKTQKVFNSDVIVATASKLIQDLADDPTSPIVVTESVRQYSINQWKEELNDLIAAAKKVILPETNANGEEVYDIENLETIDIAHVLSLNSEIGDPTTDEVGKVLGSQIITDTIIDQIIKQESLVVTLTADSPEWKDNGTEKGEIRLIFEAVQTLFKDDEINLENIDANLITDLSDNDVDNIFKSIVVAETIIDIVKNIDSDDIVVKEENIVKSQATKKADWAEEMKNLIKAIDVVLLPQPGEDKVDLNSPVVDVNHILGLESTKDNPETDEVGLILKSMIITDSIIKQIIAQEDEGTLKVKLAADDDRWYGDDGEIRAIFDALKVIFGDDEINVEEFQINGILDLEEAEKLTLVNSIVVSDTMIKEIKAIDSIGTISLPDDGDEYNAKWYGEDGELKKFLDAAVILLGEDADLDNPNYEFDTNRLLQLTEDDKETLLDSLVVSDTLIKNIKTIETLDTTNEALTDNPNGTYNANWYGENGELSRFITAAPILLGSDADINDPNYSFDVNRILDINNQLGHENDEVGTVISSLVIKDTLLTEVIKLDTGNDSVIAVNIEKDSNAWYDQGNKPGEIRNLLSSINIILEKDAYGRVDLTNPVVDFDKIYSLSDDELDVVLSSKIVSDTLVLTLIDTEELTTDGILLSAKQEANYSGSLASWKQTAKYREQVCDYSGWEAELKAILTASRTMMVKEGDSHVFDINAVLTADDATLNSTFDSVIINDTFWSNMDTNTASGGSLYNIIVYPSDLVKDEQEAISFVKAIKVIIGEEGDIENIENFDFDTFIENYEIQMLDSRLVEYSMALQVDTVLTGTGALAPYMNLPANKNTRINTIENDLDNLLTVIKELTDNYGIDYNNFTYEAFEDAIADESDASGIARTLLTSDIIAGSMNTMMSKILSDSLGSDYQYVTINSSTDWGTSTRDAELYRVLNVLSKVSYFREDTTSFADLSVDNKDEFTAPLIAVSESTVLWKLIPSFVDTALENVEEWKSQEINEIPQDEWSHEIDVIADIVISINELGIGLGSNLDIIEDFDDNQIDAFGNVLKNVSRSKVLLIENINDNLEVAINDTFDTEVELTETVVPVAGQTREAAWAIEIDTMIEAVEQIRDIANNGLEFDSVDNILASSLKLARFLDTCESSVILAPAVQEVYVAQVPSSVQIAVVYFAGERLEGETWEDYLYVTLSENRTLLGLFL